MEKVSLFGMSAIVCGEGETLLLLHGFLSCKESFIKQINFFKAQYKVVAVDLSGFGQSGDIDRVYTLKTYVDEVKKIIDYFGGKAIVVGHSFGGRIAIKLAAEYSSSVKALVLTDSAGLKPKRGIKYFYRRTGYLLTRKFMSRQKVEKKFFSPDYINLSPLMKRSFKIITNEYLDGILSEIVVFTLIVWGKNDRETPFYMAKRLQKGISSSRLYVVNGAGHFPFIDKPDEFNYIVREFLSEV